MSNLTIIIAALTFAIFLVLALSIIALGASFGQDSAAFRSSVQFPILSLSHRIAQRVHSEPYESDGCKGALTPEEEAWFASSDSSHTISDSKRKIPAPPNITPVKLFSCTLFDDDERLHRSTMASTISTVKPLFDFMSSDEVKEPVFPTCALLDDNAGPHRFIMVSSIQPTISRQAPVEMDAKISSNPSWDKTKTNKATHASMPLRPDAHANISTLMSNFGAPSAANNVKSKRDVHHANPCAAVGTPKPAQRPTYNISEFSPKSTKERSHPVLPLPLPVLGDIKNIIVDNIEAQIPPLPSSSSQRSFLNISSNHFSSLTHALSKKAQGVAFASNDIKSALAKKSRACRSSLVNRLDRVSSPQVLPFVNATDKQIYGSLRDWLQYKAVSTFSSRMGLEEDDSESFKFKLDEQDKYFLMDDEDDVNDLEAGHRTLNDDFSAVNYACMSHKEFCSVFLEEEE